jgi:hypothetical protein
MQARRLPEYTSLYLFDASFSTFLNSYFLKHSRAQITAQLIWLVFLV